MEGLSPAILKKQRNPRRVSLFSVYWVRSSLGEEAAISGCEISRSALCTLLPIFLSGDELFYRQLTVIHKRIQKPFAFQTHRRWTEAADQSLSVLVE